MSDAWETGNCSALPGVVQMKDNDGVEQTEGEGERHGIVDRAKGVVRSVRQQASRSVDVMTGADIRRFDEFTDATTRAVVGVHQDLSELREQVARTQGAVDDVQERLTARLDQLEQSDGRRATLTPWIVAVGVAAVALLLSITALAMGMT